MSDAPLRVFTFLAPNMRPVYAFLARRMGEWLGRPVRLEVGESYDQLEEADVAFVCGLAYVERADEGPAAVEPVAAPLLQGKRYGGRPVYYSDVIVRRDSSHRSFADLRGRSWAYNEPHSHSGFGVTRYRLAELDETFDYFGQVVQSGWHEESIRLVCTGAVDASAIDSQVLAVALREQPGLANQLRIIDSLGPSTIQPVVVSRRLPGWQKDAIRGGLLDIADDPSAQPHLLYGFIERFVAVDDAAYDDIRHMRAVAGDGVGNRAAKPQAAGHLPAMSRQ
jgi:phosphonate transport system substrate-binding protein